MNRPERTGEYKRIDFLQFDIYSRRVLNGSLSICGAYFHRGSTQALRHTPHSLTSYLSPQSPWQLVHRALQLLLQSPVIQCHSCNYSTRSLDKQEHMNSKSFTPRLLTTHTPGKGSKLQLRRSRLSSNPTIRLNTALASQSFRTKTRKNYSRCSNASLSTLPGSSQQ